jgi:hypothetical protein
LGAAGRMTRRDHHLAPRPALVRASKRGDWSCPRSTIAIRTPQARRAATTLGVRRPIAVPLRSHHGAASLELIHHQQFNRCESTRGYHAWTKEIWLLATGASATSSATADAWYRRRRRRTDQWGTPCSRTSAGAASGTRRIRTHRHGRSLEVFPR